MCIIILISMIIKLKSCYPTWNVIFQNMFDLFMFAILYILPMSLIFYTYRRVIKVLWKIDKSIAWDESPSSNNNNQTNNNNSSTNTNATTNNGREQRSTGQMTATTYSFSKKGGSGKNSATASSTGDDLASTAVVITADSNTNKSNISSSNLSNKNNNANLNSSSLKPPPPSYTAYTMANGSSAAMNKMKNQLIARRKAAKMLISVAVMFAICYLPIHILNITRFVFF